LGSRTGWTSGVGPALDLLADLVEAGQLDPFVGAEILDHDAVAADAYEIALERGLHVGDRRRAA
jgi:hypothetical protein